MLTQPQAYMHGCYLMDDCFTDASHILSIYLILILVLFDRDQRINIFGLDRFFIFIGNIDL